MVTDAVVLHPLLAKDPSARALVSFCPPGQSVLVLAGVDSAHLRWVHPVDDHMDMRMQPISMLDNNSLRRRPRNAEQPTVKERPLFATKPPMPGLPGFFPFAFAALIPAFVRSEISARSSWATAPRTCRENMPCGVDVSIGSRSDRKCAPWR